MSTSAEQVMHYAVDAAGRAACGSIDTAGASPWRQYVTCGDCLAEIEVGEAVNRVPTDPAVLADTLADLEAEFPGEFLDEAGPAIACSSMHEHDEAACAAPTVAELRLETVGAQLADLYARISGVFDDEADTASALSRVGDRIGQMLGELGVPVPAAASMPSVTCPVCGARLSFGRWGEHSAAWIDGQVRAHVADCQASALSWVLYRPENGLAGDVLVSAGPEGPAPGNTDPIELARQQLAEHAAGREAWVVKVFGPDDRLRAFAEWEQGSAVGYAAGKAR